MIKKMKKAPLTASGGDSSTELEFPARMKTQPTSPTFEDLHDEEQ